MKKVHYDFIVTGSDSLVEEIRAINSSQDKIIAVTQNGDCYTIFYEMYGNKKDGE